MYVLVREDEEGKRMRLLLVVLLQHAAVVRCLV